MPRLAFPLALLILPGALLAQHPLRHPADAVEARFARSQPVIGYTLRIADGDLSGFDVEIRIRNAPDTIRLAMAAHPEYDDRFWRYVDGPRAESRSGTATVAREDSALWRVIAPGGESIVRYRIRLPASESGRRAAWRPFLSATGGLVGGPHAFMYVLGATLAPVHVALELPAGWDAATGLTPTADPRTFFAPSADVLIDSPILAGRFRRWRFSVDGVPHNIIYWPAPNATPFDSTAFVAGRERLAQQTIALFGRAPYREYTFLYQDDSYGGLEHLNSVTLGAPSAELARDPMAHLEETAHEFIHTWNLMRIRPAERIGVDYRTNGRSTGLWWSEGLTIYYADLLLRRAGLPVGDTTRQLHLERSIERYLFNPGNFAVSPERASFAEYGGSPGELGDYDPSVHLQGEMLGAMLDLVIRDATAGRRSMDDVMRTMLERFSGERGFTGRDIERTIAETCGCEMRTFFDAYVRAPKAIDFDRYLRLAGLRMRVTRTPALDREGRPAVDMRMVAWQPPSGGRLSLIITNPHGAWGKAGLHTGDRLVSMNGRPIATWQELRSSMAALRIGDTVEVAVERPAGPWRTKVMAAGYDRPHVRIEEVAGATPRQLETRSRWLAGKP